MPHGCAWQGGPMMRRGRIALTVALLVFLSSVGAFLLQGEAFRRPMGADYRSEWRGGYSFQASLDDGFRSSGWASGAQTGGHSAAAQAFQVTYTLVLLNNTLIPGNFLPTNGFDPQAVAFDSFNGHMYVADESSNTVTVIDGATNKVVKMISVGYGPRSVAFDTTN